MFTVPIMKPECVELVCSSPHAWNPVAAAFHKPSSKAARIARSASPFVSPQSDFERSIVDASAGRNGSCARNIRTSESVADPTSASDAVKTKRSEGAYVAHNSGTHSNSNFAPFVFASSSVVAATVVVGGAVIAAAPPSSSDEDKAATGGGARCSPFFAAEDAADGFSEGDEEDEEVVANAARERRRVFTLTRPDVNLIDDDGISLVFIVPLILVVFTVDIDMEDDVL